MNRKSRTGVYAIMESLLKRKWFLDILRQLAKKQSGVEMISHAAPDMPIHVMNGRLRTLLRYGLVLRCSRQIASQNVEYKLSRFGKKVTEILDRVDALNQEFGLAMQASAFAGDDPLGDDSDLISLRNSARSSGSFGTGDIESRSLTQTAQL